MPPFDQNTNQPGNFSSGDFSGQLNDMLAPYQQMAQKMQSPYATMSPNSWLGRNHPQVAGMLDNAFLTMGSIPSPQGPEGVGGGISRMMQGLMGAQQYRRQQMMQNMMMPYQMMMPQLEAQHKMAEIQTAKTGMEREQDYHEMITDRYGPGGLAAQRNQMEQQRITNFLNPSILDHRRALLQAGAPTTADVNDLTPSQLEKYNDAFQGFQSERQRTSGPYDERIDTMMGSADPAIRAEGMRRQQAQLDRIQAGAGARAQAISNITEPLKTADQFYAQERQTAYSTLPKPMTDVQYHTTREFDRDYHRMTAPQRVADYDTYFKGEQAKKQKIDIDLTKWKKSSAFPKGVSFSEYQQDPGKWDKATPSPAATSPSPDIIMYGSDGKRQ